MKKILIITCMSLLVLAGCSNDSQEGVDDRKLVVYTSVDQFIAEEILNDFEDETGIEVLPVYDIEASKLQVLQID